ncbi:MAG: DUF928 domain-containing protein [Leptolyngbya sp. BL-A-14]
MRYFHQLIKVSRVAQSLLLALLTLPASLAFHQSIRVAHSEPKPSYPSGRPQRIATGGKRGSCPEVSPPLLALVPPAVATTLSARPSFWFYSPYKGQSLPAKFSIQSDDSDVIEPIMVTLPAKPSFVRIRLRSTDAPLKPNQPYHWFLQVLCSDPNQPKETVEGSIQLTTAALPGGTLASREKQTTAKVADEKLFDAVAALAELRLQKPQDASLTEEWQWLLRSLKFELERNPLTPEQVNELATAPLNDLSQ